MRILPLTVNNCPKILIRLHGYVCGSLAFTYTVIMVLDLVLTTYFFFNRRYIKIRGILFVQNTTYTLIMVGGFEVIEMHNILVPRCSSTFKGLNSPNLKNLNLTNCPTLWLGRDVRVPTAGGRQERDEERAAVKT